MSKYSALWEYVRIDRFGSGAGVFRTAGPEGIGLHLPQAKKGLNFMSVLQTIELKKYYGTEPTITRALDGVNFSVEDGGFVAVVGTSGSGKPTLLHMLADEPAGNLDSKTSADVLGLLKRTSMEFYQTIVMIARNNGIAQLADRIVRIEDGKIIG